MNQLFDKQIEIFFYDSISSDRKLIDSITTPESGIKPNLSLFATWQTADIIFDMRLKLVNFYPSSPLSDYKWITVKAGYLNDEFTSVIEGQVMVMSRESPSPEGVMTISFLTGNAVSVINQDISINLLNGNSKSLFQSIIASLEQNGDKWSLIDSTESRPFDKMNFSGKVSTFLSTLKDRWGIQYYVKGNSLYVYEPSKGSTGVDVIEIKYLSSPPMADPSGFTFTAPWIPSLVPGMIIKINPEYFKQTLGGQNVKYQENGLFVTQRVEVVFSTTQGQNQMTVLALNTYDITQQS